MIAYLVAMVMMLLEINLFWPLLNLLPILPLDGGQISREVFQGMLGQRGLLLSLGISFGLSVLLALDMVLGFIPFLPSDNFMAIFFALLAVTSFQLLQAERHRGRWRDDDRLPWE